MGTGKYSHIYRDIAPIDLYGITSPYLLHEIMLVSDDIFRFSAYTCLHE